MSVPVGLPILLHRSPVATALSSPSDHPLVYYLFHRQDAMGSKASLATMWTIRVAAQPFPGIKTLPQTPYGYECSLLRWLNLVSTGDSIGELNFIATDAPRFNESVLSVHFIFFFFCAIMGDDALCPRVHSFSVSQWEEWKGWLKSTGRAAALFSYDKEMQRRAPS